MMRLNRAKFIRAEKSGFSERTPEKYVQKQNCVWKIVAYIRLVLANKAEYALQTIYEYGLNIGAKRKQTSIMSLF